LFRSRDDRMVAGVAGGLAEAWDVDPSLIRIVWALLTIFTGGIAFVVYIVMAIVIPEEEAVWPAGSGEASAPSPGRPAAATGGAHAEAKAARRAARRERRADGSNLAMPIIALGLIGLGAFFLVRQWLPPIDFGLVWPVILILIGIGLLVAAFGRRSSDDGRGSGSST
jgi:phage shock protein PspC (stress-responsive transcriptional regulator)